MKLNKRHRCTQRGCCRLRDSSCNIWNWFTVVFFSLRTLLMREISSFPQIHREKCSLRTRLPPPAKHQKNSTFTFRLLRLKIFSQAGVHIWPHNMMFCSFYIFFLTPVRFSCSFMSTCPIIQRPKLGFTVYSTLWNLKFVSWLHALSTLHVSFIVSVFVCVCVNTCTSTIQFGGD